MNSYEKVRQIITDREDQKTGFHKMLEAVYEVIREEYEHGISDGYEKGYKDGYVAGRVT